MKKIQVTEPFLPPREIYDAYLDGIWDRNWLTNEGPLSLELESALIKYTQQKNLLLTSNGTAGIQLALKSLALTGEVITTPFSYVATTSSLIWEGLTPIFADVDVNSFNIDPDNIEKLISDKTSAILATHVFGNACNIDALKKIAKKHNVKLIFDAAHCFGTTYDSKSIFAFGDASIASFHATKVFHTIEGGAIILKNRRVYKKAYYMRNFGHFGEGVFKEVGINIKNSEFHAAMGLANLPFLDQILASRKNQYQNYTELLAGLPLKFQSINPKTKYNHAYFPIVFESEKVLLQVQNELNKKNIFPRRYFYPSLNELDYVTGQICPVSEYISKRILCLPLYRKLSSSDQKYICEIIKESM